MTLTSEVARIGYVAILVGGLLLLGLRRRQFDFLPIAYLGVAFYFLPLISGHVLQLSPHLGTSIQPVVYLIASAFLLALMAAAALTPGRLAIAAPPTSAMAVPLLLLAVLGLVAALVQSGGAVIQLDKVEALQNIGIAYVLFETAASLACIAAVIERRWLVVVAATLLLVLDLVAGFRNYATLTTLAVGTTLLAPQGRIHLYRKALTYGTSLLAIVIVMLLTHSVRPFIFDRTAAFSRSDTFQFQTTKHSGAGWLPVVRRLIEKSEPYVIQATLVGTVETGMSCRPSNILKSAWLLVPPGMLRFVPTNPYPGTFYEEYKPILYPKITYGTAGNIWAEMLCRFGFAGITLFGGILVVLLLWLGRLLVTASPIVRAPIAFIGVILAFYIHRNDLHYTLVMIKQTAYVFLAAYFLRRAKDKIVDHFAKTSPPTYPGAGGSD